MAGPLIRFVSDLAAAVAHALYVACCICSTCTAQGLHRYVAPQHQFSPLKAPLVAAEPAAGAVMCPPAFEGMSELKVEFQGHIMRLEQLIEHHGLREADPTGGCRVLLHCQCSCLANHIAPQHHLYTWSSRLSTIAAAADLTGGAQGLLLQKDCVGAVSTFAVVQSCHACTEIPLRARLCPQLFWPACPCTAMKTCGSASFAKLVANQIFLIERHWPT